MSRISIIIPVYNAEKYLGQCISSIANQTMKDIEIIAINDGSTDNSLRLLDELSSKYAGKLTIINQENKGAGAARNTGLDAATGDFIKFVDADDYLNVDILSNMYELARENNVRLVRGNYQTLLGPFKFEDLCSWSDIRASGIVDVRNNRDYIITETPGIGNKLIGRELIGDMRFPEKTKWEDLALMPVVVASSEKLFHMNAPVYNYRVHMNTTINDFINKIPNILDIIKCLDIMEAQMRQRGLTEEYSKQIESLYILHTLFRVENAMLWVNFPHDKKATVISSLLSILDAKYPNWQSNDIINRYGNINGLFKFDMSRLPHYINEYRTGSKEEAEKNIGRSFR